MRDEGGGMFVGMHAARITFDKAHTPVLNNTVSASTTNQTIHAFAMNGASMNWACLVARICCLFVAFQGFVGAIISDNSKNINSQWYRRI